MRWLRYGEDAALVEFDSLGTAFAARALLSSADLPGLTELVPGARTVLIAGRPGSPALTRARELLAGADLDEAPPAQGRLVTLRVRYDGEDLDEVARAAGVTAEDVVALHTGAEYTVAFMGFAPGFGYLAGLPGPLQQPRLATPRTRVPAGAVGVAGEFTAAYPRPSPGGWRLIGHTEEQLFDPAAERPALLAPGDRVRFVAKGTAGSGGG
jgi:KipI family sensor histidine kinase inhibitor